MNAHTRRIDNTVWSFFHAKLALIIWGIISFTHPSRLFINEIGSAAYYTTISFVVFGCVAGIIGLFMTTTYRSKVRHQGLIVELFGLTFSFVGMLALFTTLFITSFNDDIASGSTIAFLYAYSALLFGRITLVQKAIRRSSFT